MGMNLVEKIVQDHLVAGALEAGGEIGIRIDHTLTQDATGTMVYLQFEAMGLDRIRAERAVSYVDHNTVQVGPENADDHAYLQSAAARFGAVFSKPGNGICHQLHLERFGEPGKTLLGSDSHTPTGGGLGMFAIGAGGLDVAVAMGGGPFYLPAPRVVRVALRGKLGPWVSAKDVILKMLERLGTRGNVGTVLEYGGPGVRTLDVPERATIANMGAECGVTTSVFPSDTVTRAFLEAQGRGEAWRALGPDKDAAYAETLELDLAALEPLAAEPHSPGNIAPVASLTGLKVNQVLIGSCTNSSYRDLKTVARLLAGRRVHPDVTLGIAPGSRQVVEMLAAEGALGDLLAAGARLLENACGFCIGNSMSPGTNGVSLRTSNRNFEGRSGTPSGRVYLVSPETAAVAAVTGRVLDPRLSEAFEYPRVRRPKAFTIDDGLFIFPPADGSDVEIVRGPGIRPVPANAPLPETLAGDVTIKVGDNITTDHIMPAGARLKYRSNIETYSGFVFEGVDPEFAARAARNRDAGVHNVIVAGDSYGQGSSREHAALCPMYLGVKAVVARSFERIHLANLINFGIIPFRFEKKDDYNRLAAGNPLRAEGLRDAVAGDGRAVLRVPGKGLEIAVCTELTERQKRIVLAGGLLNAVWRQENAT
jgi:aconitate hydratase